jgi:Mg/Co/Ni transporter MgtE
MSSFIISYNEALLKRHIVIVQFLTMLVGAGGNAGNQATVRVIRGLATGTISPSNTQAFIRNELLIGLCLSIILGVTGCLRALAFSVPLPETICITTALLMIVIISVAIGATLPLGMKHVGIDPAHSSTTIQVLMDILGVTITVYVSAAVLDSKLGEFLGIQNILLQAVQYEEIAPP